MSFSVVLVCAGKGRRFGDKKQFCLLNGIPVFLHSLLTFQRWGAEIILVIEPEDQGNIQTLVTEFEEKHQTKITYRTVSGGSERYISVWNGVQKCQTEMVFVHDAARPLIHLNDLNNLLSILKGKDEHWGVVLSHPLTDTVKRVDSDGKILESLPREKLNAVSTPQGFYTRKFVQANQAFNQAFQAGEHNIPTDDVEIFMHNGGKVMSVMAQHPNPKLTYPDDLEILTKLYQKNKQF